ncbi:MAG TPA: VWA domain-containing protein, partial [Acidobacteriota bacterium]|nr:VWA domain-containing protein [Acidobacteriota bacterium]
MPLVLLFSWELARRATSAAADLPKVARAWAGAFDVALGTRHTTAQTRPRIWLWFGLALCIIALARPQWGVIEEKVFDQSREVLIAVDLSRSMMAQDVKPSRLDRSKLLITSLLDGLKGERVGLVLFAGTAFLQSPLSADYEILREFLPALKPEFLPEGGSNYKAMLETSMQAFGTSAADRYLIILSDGESTEDGWKSLGEQLKTKGIRVIGLGVGTSAGSFIPDGSGGFVKDDRGAVVLSRLNSSTLQDLAQTTAGAYTDASAWIDMPSLLKKTVEAGKKGEFSEKNTARKIERFQWFLAPGLLLLFISFWAEFPVRPRERALPLGGSATRGARKAERGTPKPHATAKVAALAGLFWLSAFSVPRSAAAQPAPSSDDTLSKPLTTTVARLADKSVLAPKDCADLAQTTITYGQRLKSSQQRPPEGVINDALAAVDIGEKTDAKAADWPRLRQELEQLLEKPPEEKKQDEKQDQQQKQEQKNQQQNQQNQDQQNQDQQQQQQQDQQNSEQQKQEQQQQKQQQDAFGDMKDQQEPPKTDEEKEPPQQPPQPQTQKVGGQKEKKMEVPLDPDLA